MPAKTQMALISKIRRWNQIFFAAERYKGLLVNEDCYVLFNGWRERLIAQSWGKMHR